MERVAKVAGVRPPRFGLPRWMAAPFGWAGDVMERLVDREPMINSVTVGYGYCNTFQFSSEKAKRELGYRISPLEPAIADALTWFRQHGMV